jgi:hypothetical protein
MKSKLFILCLANITLLACCSAQSNHEQAPTRSFYLQTIFNSPIVARYIRELSQQIRTIVADEFKAAGITEPIDFDAFMPKPLQRITGYYIDSISRCGEDLLVPKLDKWFGAHLTSHKPLNVAITAHPEFFAPGNDELVVIVADNKNELSKLNRDLREFIHTVNNDYKQCHCRDMYNIAKSEEHPFLPHMGIGRLRTGSIREFIGKNSPSKSADAILKQIKDRVLRATREYLDKELAAHRELLPFEKVTAFWPKGPEGQRYIKEWFNGKGNLT